MSVLLADWVTVGIIPPGHLTIHDAPAPTCILSKLTVYTLPPWSTLIVNDEASSGMFCNLKAVTFWLGVKVNDCAALKSTDTSPPETDNALTY